MSEVSLYPSVYAVWLLRVCKLSCLPFCWKCPLWLLDFGVHGILCYRSAYGGWLLRGFKLWYLPFSCNDPCGVPATLPSTPAARNYFSFYPPYENWVGPWRVISWLGSFRARFQSFGQQPEMTIFQFGIPLQILHFWAWQLSGKISRFGPAAWNDYLYRSWLLHESISLRLLFCWKLLFPVPSTPEYKGKDKNQTAEDLRRISTGHPEIKATCFDFKFPGRGQRDTPVTDAKGIVKIKKFGPGNFRAWRLQGQIQRFGPSCFYQAVWPVVLLLY